MSPSRLRRSEPFCSDVIAPDGSAQEIWRVTRDPITIQLSAPGIDRRSSRSYVPTIRIEGAEFMNDSGGRVRMPQPMVVTALVGWLAG